MFFFCNLCGEKIKKYHAWPNDRSFVKIEIIKKKLLSKKAIRVPLHQEFHLSPKMIKKEKKQDALVILLMVI